MKITGIWGEHFVPRRRDADPSPCRLPKKNSPTILLCVKSKTQRPRPEAAPLLKEGGIMVSIQNGLNNWEAIARQVGEERTVGARVIFGAEIPAGPAKVTVNADDVLLGEPFRPVNRPLLEPCRRISPLRDSCQNR